MALQSVDLPEAGGAEHHHDLAGCHLEVDVLEHVQLAEVLVDVLDLDHGGSARAGLGHGLSVLSVEDRLGEAMRHRSLSSRPLGKA